jgi:hypothetical protein
MSNNQRTIITHNQGPKHKEAVDQRTSPYANSQSSQTQRTTSMQVVIAECVQRGPAARTHGGATGWSRRVPLHVFPLFLLGHWRRPAAALGDHCAGAADWFQGGTDCSHWVGVADQVG